MPAPKIECAIEIAASPPVVWDALTNPASMPQWMGEPDMRLEVSTTWTVGAPIVLRGFLGFPERDFVNTGTVLEFDPPRHLRYTHRSSISDLPDAPASYTEFAFRLEPVAERTRLSLVITGFPTETIFKHLALYWRGTLGVLKRFVEERHA